MQDEQTKNGIKAKRAKMERQTELEAEEESNEEIIGGGALEGEPDEE